MRAPAGVPFTPEDLVARGALGPRMMRFLSACVRGRANVMVSGGTGSGKTTLLGVLSGFIADDERLITIEDAAQSLVSADDVGEPDRDEEGLPLPHPKASNSRTLRRSGQAQRREVNAGPE
jgi:Flp pilus assembly CpaF family ATPase